MSTDLFEAWNNALGKPPIVCLIGSTRFLEQFFEAGWRYTLRGYIVLSIGVVQTADAQGGHGGEMVSQDCADMLDELHRRKIDMAEEVFCVNPGGYIGKSTAAEIEYSKVHGKRLLYLVDPTPSTAPAADGESK